MIALLWVASFAVPASAHSPRAPAAPDPCKALVGESGHPEAALAESRAHAARGRSTGDEGEFALAAIAADCAVARRPDDDEAALFRAHTLIQQHRFAEAAEAARARTGGAHAQQAWLLLGDTAMERGALDEAAAAYQRAADLRPGLAVYDRVGWLRWMEGDLPGAREMAVLAVQAGVPSDPEPLAWALSRLGWLNVLARQPAPELDAALALIPDYAPALLARGRARLDDRGPAADVEGGLADLRALTHSLEALRWRNDFDAVDIPRELDPRGWADFIAPSRPREALAVAEEELRERADAITRMTYAWALHHAHRAGAAEEARAALDTGCVEPRVLHHAAIILGDREVATRALSMGAGLTPTERGQLDALLAP